MNGLLFYFIAAFILLYCTPNHILPNHPCQLSLAIRPWVGAMSTGQRAVMLCDWGVKARIAGVYKTVCFCVKHQSVISERSYRR